IALMKMRQGQCRHLPVLQEGQLVGILSDRDLKEAWPSDSSAISSGELVQNVGKIKVKDVMTQTLITIDEETSIEETAVHLLKRNISALLVVNQRGHLTGIVTVKDLLRELVRLTSY
ncbi:CBS domain-containing protein, partial [Deinococcus hopiensis]